MTEKIGGKRKKDAIMGKIIGDSSLYSSGISVKDEEKKCPKVNRFKARYYPTPERQIIRRARL